MRNLSTNAAPGRIHAWLRRPAFATALVLGVLGLPVMLPGLLGDYALEVGFRLLVLLSLAEAWNLLAGYGGMVSLGTASFFGVGGYVLIGLMNVAGLPVLPSLLIAALSGSVLAVLMAPAVFRLRGLYFTVGTLAFSEALRLFMVNSNDFGGASGWIAAQDPPDGQTLYAWAWMLCACTAGVFSLYLGSRLAVTLKAVRDDETAAAQVGVNTFLVKLLAFMTAGALMAAAGGLQAVKLGAIEPYGMFGMSWSIAVLSIVLIGGMGWKGGALLGTSFIVALGEWLADYPNAHLAITGVILMVVIRYAPQGLAGLLNGAACRRFGEGADEPVARAPGIHGKAARPGSPGRK